MDGRLRLDPRLRPELRVVGARFGWNFLRLAAATEEAGTGEGEQSGGCRFWDRRNAQGVEGEFIATTGTSGVVAAPAQIIGCAFIEA